MLGLMGRGLGVSEAFPRASTVKWPHAVLCLREAHGTQHIATGYLAVCAS